MRTRRWIIVAAVTVTLVAAATVGLAVGAPVVAAAACPQCYGLSEIADGVYADRDDDAYRRMLDAADRRISTFYGGRVSDPRVLICSTSECYRRLGGGGEKGRALGRWSLMLAPAGANEVIATHELAHAELHERLGSAASDVPDWFDEGLAVLISDDERYLRPESEADRCLLPWEEALPVVSADWAAATRDLNDRSYLQAACVVSRWVSEQGGSEAVLRLVDDLQAGRKPPSAPW
ncbi:hypothetical protein [Actinoplanes rectilineatus]|uniref:hypothetical protein n=1 Tax=Actinoplanes rectilineatus TaxID=113571 RepID=UPI0005F2BBF6|nr:hypothetical protein [Actinoplanes rectilineatus]